MRHTLRFSAFIAMVMLSFALAFHAMFHTCGTSNCPEEAEESPLGDAFGTFGRSFVTVFSSALGGPDFDVFNGEHSECNCDLPEGAQSAGIFLMVVSQTYIRFTCHVESSSKHSNPCRYPGISLFGNNSVVWRPQILSGRMEGSVSMIQILSVSPSPLLLTTTFDGSNLLAFDSNCSGVHDHDVGGVAEPPHRGAQHCPR